MSARNDHCLALGTDSHLYAWGSRDFSKSGNDANRGAFGNQPHPAPALNEP